MMLDTQSLFSGTIAADGTRTPQAITATAISTNVIDLRSGGSSGLALADEGINGANGGMFLVISTAQAFNNLTSLTITLESDSAAGLATAPVVHYSKTILLAALTANTTLIRVPIPSDDYKRFLGVRYTVTGTAPTTGTVNAALVFDINRNVAYPGSFTVDV